MNFAVVYKLACCLLIAIEECEYIWECFNFWIYIYKNNNKFVICYQSCHERSLKVFKEFEIQESFFYWK